MKRIKIDIGINNMLFPVQAKKVLHVALESEVSVDRWAAAQCLAHEGICNSLVVGEIIKQLLDTEDTVKHERAIYLLGKLSIFSVSLKRVKGSWEGGRVCNSLEVGEIIKQLLDTEDTVKHERAIYLLGKLSIFSVSLESVG